MARRETLVQLNDDLVAALDKISATRGLRRSALIRYVLETFIASEDEKEKERRLIEGYRNHPPDEPDEWGDIEAWSEAVSSESMPDVSWDEDKSE